LKRIKVDKVSLRKGLLTRLSELPAADVHSLSLALTGQLIKFFNLFSPLASQIGAGYLPLKAEIAPVYQELLRAVPLVMGYPILEKGEMKFAIPQGMPRGGTWLEPPYHGVNPQWLLVPGVAFDLLGARLGRGGGYYDRYLEQKEVVKIGLAWSEQLIEKVPVESHDSFMDFIITEKFCWNVNQQKRF
jgi:5-formyltetrahydrofolate cyclo-ligase